MTTEDAIEREVQRRLTGRLASAGVRSSEVAMEILWMLPPEFVRAYRDLFSRCFGDALGTSGAGGGMRAAAEAAEVGRARIRPTKVGVGMRVHGKDQRDPETGGVRLEDDGKGGLRPERPKLSAGSTGTISRQGSEPFGGGARHGGARTFRDHWPVRSEAALRTKTSIDRKLVRLAREIGRESKGAPRGASEGELTVGSKICGRCQVDLTAAEENLGWMPGFCPGCGQRVERRGRKWMVGPQGRPGD